MREGELRPAAKVLGAADVVLLEFADSGMTGRCRTNALAAVAHRTGRRGVPRSSSESSPMSSSACDFEAINDHRDHVRIGEATTLAFARVRGRGDARLYHWTLVRLADGSLARAR